MNELQEFTNLYPLLKTLRFELIPEESTRKRFQEWLEELDNKNKSAVETTSTNIINGENLILKDKRIAAAYIALKPVLDKLHEEFIEVSLSSDEALGIDFSSYWEAYQDKKVTSDRENALRAAIGKTFQAGIDYFYKNFVESEVKIKEKNKNRPLFSENILSYIDKKAVQYTSNDLTEEELKMHLNCFKGFYTYLSGYNTNRRNYYETKNEKSTAIATRIIHENLPKFCNNIIRFYNRKEEYLKIVDWLKNKEKVTQIKNAEKGLFETVEPICEKYFVIGYFNHCLTQKQIEEYNRIIGNYNSIINLYNQVKKQEDSNFKKLDEFVTLYKQIGCGRNEYYFPALIAEKTSELTEKQKQSGAILSIEQLLQAAKKAGDKYFNTKGEKEISVIDFIDFLSSCTDWRGIYWSKSAITSISNRYFANWHDIIDKLKDKEACATYDKKREVPVQLRDAVELSELFEVLDSESPEYIFKDSYVEGTIINNHRYQIDIKISTSRNLINLLCEEIKNHISDFLADSYNIVTLQAYRQKDINDNGEDLIIKQIKNWFDCATDAMRIVRYFAVRANKMKGHTANAEVEKFLDALLRNPSTDWFGWYDLIRNYLTKKPQDDVKDKKLKLNFDNGLFLNGFVESKTDKNDHGTQYGGYIFRKKHVACNEYEYYIGVSTKTKLFRCHLRDNIENTDKSDFERLEYYQMKSTTPYPNEYGEKKLAIQNIVKELIISISDTKQKIEEANKITNKIPDKDLTPNDLYRKISTSQNFQHLLKNERLLNEVNSCIQLILNNCARFTKMEAINSLQKNSYSDWEGLTQLINDLKDITNSRNFDFFPISQKEFEVHNGKDLFLFKISNKDLSYCENYSKGYRKKKEKQKENLHTLFFRALMHEDGFGDTVDIGKGEIFFREKAFDYDNYIWEKGHHAEQLKGKFSYPIISKKRFAQDKYLFHLSIFLNYKATTKEKEVEEKLKEAIQKIENMNFVGIDRGEKHLVYSCIIDKDCNILKCQHHDNINRTDYVQKLDAIASSNIIAKKNWQQQDGIRNLKEGYISHIVHHLTNCVIKDETGKINPHAYIVLEDLSVEMKQSRRKVEKQIYQKLETALAKKLNFIVDKEAKNGDIGSVSQALQLTPPLKTYEDIKNEKQFGIMLYTRANYTSITDPATGWRQTIYLKNGTDREIKNQILSKFDDFGYDGTDYYFEYTEEHAGKTWRLYSGKDGKSLPRFRNNKQKEADYAIWVPEQIDVVNILDQIFVDFNKTKSFKKQIENGIALHKIESKKETAWQSLRYAIGVIQQIRNTGINSHDDNMLYSPVRNEDGIHFDTRNAINNGPLSLIVDADANGAYNIARKGLIMDAHIKYCLQEKIPSNSVDLFISDKEWDLWLLDRDEWKKQLPSFARNSNKK
ncbi:MAG: hypothetical protein IJX99_00150 [Clostridia bacterium]|nr:hypothetical protein [Clostridia bacterium]